MRAITDEDNEGKRVAQEKFTNSSKEKAETTKPNAGGSGCNSETAGSAPAHEFDGERQESDRETEKGNGSRVGERLAEIAFDVALRVQVQALEHLRGDAHRVGQHVTELLLVAVGVRLGPLELGCEIMGLGPMGRSCSGRHFCGQLKNRGSAMSTWKDGTRVDQEKDRRREDDELGVERQGGPFSYTMLSRSGQPVYMVRSTRSSPAAERQMLPDRLKRKTLLVIF